jgi:hypothetical protein
MAGCLIFHLEIQKEDATMGNQFEWQFHFRNFHPNEMHVRVHHAGCAKTPWHDDRPACWESDIPHCPQGLSGGGASRQ